METGVIRQHENRSARIHGCKKMRIAHNPIIEEICNECVLARACPLRKCIFKVLREGLDISIIR